jgi:hypothetical protein
LVRHCFDKPRDDGKYLRRMILAQPHRIARPASKGARVAFGEGATAMRRSVLAGVLVTVVALSSACASGLNTTAPGTGAGNAGPATTPVPAKNDCTDVVAAYKSSPGLGPAASPGGILPADAHPVSLLQCKFGIRDIPDQGQWAVIDTVRSTGSIDGFVSALRAAYVKPPQQPAPGGNGCPAVGYIPQTVTLVEPNGTAYNVGIPLWGVCPAPDPDVTKALAALPTAVVSTDLIKQVESPGAQASGCAQEFAEVAFTATQLRSSGTQRPFFSAPDPDKAITACFYTLNPNPDPVKPGGTFQSSATITGSQGALIYDGLMNAPVVTSASCTAPATEYTVIKPVGSESQWGVVELTGCKLAATDTGSLRQPAEAVLDALLAARK